MKKFSFGGYATRANLKCSDGRVIAPNAFKKNDGTKVPLVWQHDRDDINNVIGHADLTNRPDGVYARCYLNSTKNAQTAKELLIHGDLTSLSIYANRLVHRDNVVTEGVIREVSLVIAGANDGAVIDDITFEHDDFDELVSTEAVIRTYEDIELEHAAKEDTSDEDRTVGDVLDSLTEEQMLAVEALIDAALQHSEEDDSEEDDSEEDDSEEDDSEEDDSEEDDSEEDSKSDDPDSVSHSDQKGNTMKKNVFEHEKTVTPRKSITQDDFATLIHSAVKCGSFKDAAEDFLEHADYGFYNIEYLFPDAQNDMGLQTYKRQTEWVAGVINGTHHSPFSRVKTVVADLTADEARAKGYVKATQKEDEVLTLLRRTTSPCFVYKRQRLDRQDRIDIEAGGVDVIPWLNAEMNVMIQEELARAILIGDGRLASATDKIKEESIRPIWTDDDFYSHHILIPAAKTGQDLIDEMIKARKNYKGSGNPTAYVSQDILADLLLIKDGVGRPLYPTMDQLKTTLRVSNIVEVPLFDGASRTVSAATRNLIAIFVNLSDYTIGTNKGGELTHFDDFDIDFNQDILLLETYLSGALNMPKSALVFEQATA